jgi:hypothetical protein
MNASELAQKMLEWEQIKRQLDTIGNEIEAAVLEIGKTQTVGNVRATFSNGRKTYDYQAAADGHPMVSDATKSLFSKTVIDWQAICQHVGIKKVPFTQGEPSVSIKLLA